MPSARSSDFTCWLTAPGVTLSSSAARVKLRWRAAASNERRPLSGGSRWLILLSETSCAMGGLSCIRFSASIAQFKWFAIGAGSAIFLPSSFEPTTLENSTRKDLAAMTGTDDAKTIRAVIQTYLDGLYESDADKIASAFHPTSALTSVTDDGELVITPRDTWLDKVRARPSPKQQGFARHDHVLTIDLVGP